MGSYRNQLLCPEPLLAFGHCSLWMARSESFQGGVPSVFCESNISWCCTSDSFYPIDSVHLIYLDPLTNLKQAGTLICGRVLLPHHSICLQKFTGHRTFTFWGLKAALISELGEFRMNYREPFHYRWSTDNTDSLLW